MAPRTRADGSAGAQAGAPRCLGFGHATRVLDPFRAAANRGRRRVARAFPPIRASAALARENQRRVVVGVKDFETKVAVVVRDDLAVWQRLNVTAFLISGITAHAGATAIGADYLDGDDRRYLPLLVQPILVFEASSAQLQRLRERAERRAVDLAIYTSEMFVSGDDAANRAAVRSVPTTELDLVGLALRASHRDADAVLRGLNPHP